MLPEHLQSSTDTSCDSRIWDSSTGQCLKTLVHEDNAAVTFARFSPNGKFVLAATLDSCLRLWNYVEGRCVKTYQGHKNEKYSIAACFGVRPGSSRVFVACGDEEGKVVLWDVSTKEILQVLQGHDGPVLGVDVSPSGDAMATCGLDGTVRLCKVRI